MSDAPAAAALAVEHAPTSAWRDWPFELTATGQKTYTLRLPLPAEKHRMGETVALTYAEGAAPSIELKCEPDQAGDPKRHRAAERG